MDVVDGWPLALCDGRTAKLSDCIESEYITSEAVRLSLLPKYSEQYQFYYLSQMTRDEALVFKIFDSEAVGSNTTSSHTCCKLNRKPKVCLL